MSVSFCAYWSDTVISTVLICNWTLYTPRLSLPPAAHPLSSLTWPVSIMKAWFQCDSLISLFTALQVNADSKLQQAAVKHVINTALAANETLLLGLFGELQFCDELCQSQLTCCVQNETQIIFFLPQTLVIPPPPELLFYSQKDWLLAQIRESETLIQNSTGFSLSQTCNSLYISLLVIILELCTLGIAIWLLWN